MDTLCKKLIKAQITCEGIHGDKSQNARVRALNNFKNDKVRVLVASDIAARGIDIDELTHVINFDLPDQAENYVHRIGRTARAGAARRAGRANRRTRRRTRSRQNVCVAARPTL